MTNEIESTAWLPLPTTRALLLPLATLFFLRTHDTRKRRIMGPGRQGSTGRRPVPRWRRGREPPGRRWGSGRRARLRPVSGPAGRRPGPPGGRQHPRWAEPGGHADGRRPAARSLRQRGRHRRGRGGIEEATEATLQAAHQLRQAGVDRCQVRPRWETFHDTPLFSYSGFFFRFWSWVLRSVLCLGLGGKVWRGCNGGWYLVGEYQWVGV